MRLIISLIGFFAGSAVALSALLFNPLEPVPIPQAGAKIYDWSPLEFHGAELDEVTLLGLPLRQSGSPFVADEIGLANASIIVLRDPDGEAVALATRLVSMDDASDLLGADLAVNAYTNIFWPNRGSLMMYGRENRWSVMRSRIMQATGNTAANSWLVSTDRRDGSVSGILGGSGAVESTGGRYSERLQPNPSGDGTFTGSLSLEPSLR
jgi:hypothetical protein